MLRSLFDIEHEHWRDSVRGFVDTHVEPNITNWEHRQEIDAKLWNEAANLGLLGLRIPSEYGGGGVDDYRFRVVVMEELARVGAASVNAGLSLVDDLVAPYLVDLGTDDQKQKYLPGLCAGSISAALAMTEPAAGSDLRGIETKATRSRNGWVLNGSKTFITNGGHADVVIVLARTGEVRSGSGLTLFLVDRGLAGFTAGQPLDTLGRRAEAVTELFFDDVEVPAEAVLGTEGQAFGHMMERLPTERMSIAAYAIASAQAALDWTVRYVSDRKAFGKRIADFQATRFTLAELSTEIEVTRAFIDNAVLSLNAGQLSAVDAARAKWWATELLQRVLARCVQLHGGYGYMLEYPVCRAFADSRVQTIFGGSTEIMKEIIGRSLI